MRTLLPFNIPQLPKVKPVGHAQSDCSLSLCLRSISGPGSEIAPLSFIPLPTLGELPYSRSTSNDTHPHGGLATMGLLQPEDLGHHVLCGGVQQDPS